MPVVPNNFGAQLFQKEFQAQNLAIELSKELASVISLI